MKRHQQKIDVSQEKHHFFNILTAIIHNQELNLDQSTDWGDIYATSIEESLGGVVYAFFEGKELQWAIPSDVALKWFAYKRQIIEYNNRIENVLQQIAELLKPADIDFLLLKGHGLSSLYPVPFMRFSGDIDILVNDKQYTKAKQLFYSKGFISNDNPHEDFKHLGFSINKVKVELHRVCALIPGRKQNEFFQKQMSIAFATSSTGFYLRNHDDSNEENEFIKTLPPNENLVYTFIHAFIHVIASGITVRHLTDIAVLLKKYKDDINPEVVFDLLKNTNFLQEWQVFGCMLVEYLGFTPNDIPCYNSKYTNKAHELMNRILTDPLRHHRHINNKTLEYAYQCACHLRFFSLFPSKCTAILNRMILNTTLKYCNYRAYVRS